MLEFPTKALWTAAVDLGFRSNGATFAPDTIWGICIANGDERWPPRPADLHDYRYWQGGDRLRRLAADIEFLHGLHACINEAVGAAMARVPRVIHPFARPVLTIWRVLARRRAATYFTVVREVGGIAWNYT
jgi:hypothetical protein